jgi:drug/metabolite transporter (DMT)-like permease
MKASQAVSAPAPSTARVHALLLGTILIWGANWPIMKLGLDYVPPVAFASGRFLLGALVVFAILLALGRLRLPGRGDLRVVFSEALMHMAIPMGLSKIALLYVEAGRSAVLSFTTPLWITPVAVLLLGERLSRVGALGIAVGLSGLVVLFNPLGFDWSDPGTVIGNGLLMLAALTWAIAILVARTQVWNLSPLQLAPWQMLLAAAMLAVPALAFEDLTTIDWGPELAGVMAFNGPLASAFCYWGALVVSRELPSTLASMGFLGVPVTGVLLSALALGEPLTPTLLFGMAGILGGIAMVHLSGGRPRRRPPPPARPVHTEL